MKRVRPVIPKRRRRTRRKDSPKVARGREVAGEQIAADARAAGRPDPDGTERPPTWSRYRRRTRTVEQVREAVRRELEDTEVEGDR